MNGKPFLLTSTISLILILSFLAPSTHAQAPLYVKDPAGTVVAKIYPTQITDGPGNLLARITEGAVFDADNLKLGYLNMNKTYNPDNLEVLSGKHFGKIIRWRTGNIAYRIDTVDQHVQLINGFDKLELMLEDFKPDVHFIPLLFYLSFFHSSETAPPGYERFNNSFRVVAKAALPIEYKGAALTGEIIEKDSKVYGGYVPYQLDRRMDLYKLAVTGVQSINVKVTYESKEVDVRLLDENQNLIDPSDALTVDRNEGFKIYPYTIKADAAYFLSVEGYPVAKYKVEVTP